MLQGKYYFEWQTFCDENEISILPAVGSQIVS